MDRFTTPLHSHAIWSVLFQRYEPFVDNNITHMLDATIVFGVNAFISDDGCNIVTTVSVRLHQCV